MSLFDRFARRSTLHDAVVQAKVGVSRMREALAATELELAREQAELETAERRGRLAAAVPDEETVRVAGQFAARHRERIAVLGQKRSAQAAELALAEKEVEEMTAQLKAAHLPDPPAAASAEALLDQELDTAQADFAARQKLLDAAVEAQLAALKRKLGRDAS